MRIATWHLRGIEPDRERLLEWLDGRGVEVLCLQGTGVPDERFPLLSLFERGYYTKLFGPAGLALVCSEPPREVAREGPLLAATVAGVRVVNGSAPGGIGLREDAGGHTAALAARLRFFHALQGAGAQAGRTVIAGDLGVAPGALDVGEEERWRGRLGVSAAEREALATLCAQGFTDLVRQFAGGRSVVSWGGGLRTSAILASTAMTACASACRVETTGGLRANEHCPVVATFDGITLSGQAPGVLPEPIA